MDLFWVTFQSVATLLVIGILGFWIVSRRIVPGTALGLLSPLAIEVALPCFVFTRIIQEFEPDGGFRWVLLPAWWVVFSMIAALLTAATVWLSRKKFRKEFAISLFFQNAVFFPLIILTELFGAASSRLVDLFLFTLFFPALFFTSSHIFFHRRSERIRWGRVFSPVFVATVLAVVLKLSGSGAVIPEFLISALEMVGNMAAPILLLLLGGNIYVDWRERGRIYYLEILKFALVKNFLFPLVMLAVVLAIRPDPDIALLLLLQSAVPPLTSIPVVTEREGGDRSIVSQYMLGSCLFSLVSIPVAVSLFKRLFY